MSDRLTASFEERFERLVRQPAVLLFGTGLLLLIFSTWLWFAKVVPGPRAVFTGMLRRNVTTSAVVIRQVGKPQDGITVNKRSEMQYGANNNVRIVTTTKAKHTGSTVHTETIATPEKEFNRYTGIVQGQAGQPIDTKAVLNKWAGGKPGNGSAYAQTLLRPYGMPMGNFDGRIRGQLLNYLKDNEVFQTDYVVRHVKHDGRPAYEYNVNIQPVAYVAFLKAYAGTLGLHELDEVDPSAARGTPPVPVIMTIDVGSRRLVSAEYPSLGFTENFSDYNVPRKVDLPKADLSAERLQQLISGTP